MNKHDCLTGTMMEAHMKMGKVLSYPDVKKDDICTVCLSSLKENSKEYSCCASHTVEFVCGHQIHFGCFCKAAIETKKMNCPTCRFDLFAEMKKNIAN